MIAVSSALPALYLDHHFLGTTHSGKQEWVPPAWAARNVHGVEQSLDFVTVLLK
jgi:hypothetical protein